MTDTIEQKALALVNEACKSDFKDLGLTYRNNILDALLLAIEQHEAFRQEVSDAVTAFMVDKPGLSGAGITRFIIAKPDPLVEAYSACFPEDTGIPSICAMLSAEIEKRGGKIVWGDEA